MPPGRTLLSRNGMRIDEILCSPENREPELRVDTWAELAAMLWAEVIRKREESWAREDNGGFGQLSMTKETDFEGAFRDSSDSSDEVGEDGDEFRAEALPMESGLEERAEHVSILFLVVRCDGSLWAEL